MYLKHTRRFDASSTEGSRQIESISGSATTLLLNAIPIFLFIHFFPNGDIDRETGRNEEMETQRARMKDH